MPVNYYGSEIRKVSSWIHEWIGFWVEGIAQWIIEEVLWDFHFRCEERDFKKIYKKENNNPIPLKENFVSLIQFNIY